MANGIKYRIKQIGDRFFLQKRFLLFWRNLNVRTCFSSYGEEVGSYSNEKTPLWFESKETANKQITNYINNYLRPFWCLGHRVKTFFNKKKQVYYYIDTSTYEVYSDKSEDICEKIIFWEENKKKDKKREEERKKAERKVTIHNYVED